MPRKPRFTLPGIPQHVIQRGNNREPCFLAESDYRRYLDDLGACAQKYTCRIHAYVLMTNHAHLLVTPMQEGGVGEMMQALGRRYVYYINKAYHRTGTLWEGRYNRANPCQRGIVSNVCPSGATGMSQGDRPVGFGFAG